MNIIIEGLDRCGKDTQSNLLYNYLANRQIETAQWHFEALKGFNDKQQYIDASKKMYSEAINIMNSTKTCIICNRFVYGEYVYGPIYRQYTIEEACYPFELDKQLSDYNYLIVLIDSSLKCFIEREDGNSLAKSKEQCIIEYNKFIEIYAKSNLKHKLIIDIANKSINEVHQIILEFTGLSSLKNVDINNKTYKLPQTESTENNLKLVKKIVVNKIGKSPCIFGKKANSNDSRLVGDWEVKKLILMLTDIYPDAQIYYYGRCQWNDTEALEYYGPNVHYIKYNCETEVPTILLDVDEFHYIVGPHTTFNEAMDFINTETNEKKTSLCMFKNYVGPFVRVTNANPQARHFAYMSDRRYAINMYDMLYKPDKILCQVEKPFIHNTKTFTDNYGHTKDTQITITPFRFETLSLYNLDYNQFISNMENFDNKQDKLLIVSNQVAPDKAAKKQSRYDRINQYINDLKNPVIIGKWTNKDILEEWKLKLGEDFYSSGLDEEHYYQMYRQSRYSLIMFNVNDCSKEYVDNFITPKYFESAYNGCLTFVDYHYTKLLNIPEALQVNNGKELQQKIDKCNSDPEYLYSLYKLQFTTVKREYFTKEYFENTLKELK